MKIFIRQIYIVDLEANKRINFMMPLGDDNSLRKTTPIATYILIFLNIIFFLAELSGGDEFINKWAFIPQRFSTHFASDFLTIFSSMFMHAGWMHLGSNMLYLWIFGDNVEDRLGKIKYLFLYLFSGTAATFSQYLFFSASNLPNLGASGAIAGVLGAYILFFPGQKVNVLVGRSVVAMQSIIVIGFWFILQLLSSAGSFSSTQDTGGVAYLAHIGGFASGLAIATLFRIFEPKSPA